MTRGLLLVTLAVCQPVAMAAAGEVVLTPVDVVVFSDFGCPFSAQFSETVRKLMRDGVPGIVTRVRFRHLPLQLHPHAFELHYAAVAAGAQGKFWEMHDLLFSGSSAVTRDELLRFARSLGLDEGRFRKDLDGESVRRIVDADVLEAGRRGVTATPTFFVGERSYVGTRSLPELKALVEREFRHANAMAEVPDHALSRGAKDARVTVELFADLQSPSTQPALAVIGDILEAYPKDVRLQFRSFPLDFHAKAGIVHEAAMAAAHKGRFWEFVELILGHRGGLGERDLISHGQLLGVSETELTDALDSHRYGPRLEADQRLALDRGVRGSPTIVVRGNRIDGVPSAQALIDTINAQLAVDELQR